MEEQEIIEIMRIRRHQYGNVLQVLQGYLQLDMIEAAKKFVADNVELWTMEQEWYAQAGLNNALYLWKQTAAAGEQGWVVVFDEVNITSWTWLQQQDEPSRSLQEVLPLFSRQEKKLRLYISLYEQANRIDLLFSSEGENARTEKICLYKEDN